MTAHIVQMDPEVEAAIHEGRLTQIELTEAQLKLKEGTLCLRASDLLPPKIKTKEQAEKAKTTKERQAKFKKQKTEAGFKRGWIHESILALADQLGGQENIAKEIEKLRRRAEAAETELQNLKAPIWWKFWKHKQ